MANEQESKAVAAPVGKERRSSARLPLEMWVEELADDAQVFRRAGNLSRGGLHLDQTIPLAVGSRVSLRFTLPGDSAPITVAGEIVSIQADSVLGMGVKFTNLAQDAQDRIDTYLRRAATPVPLSK
jgi:type IV pilus assembly protein PilZ